MHEVSETFTVSKRSFIKISMSHVMFNKTAPQKQERIKIC